MSLHRAYWVSQQNTRKLICVRLTTVNFFLARHENGTAIVFLALHYVFLILMLVSYGRTLYVVNFIPGLVPLEPKLSLEAFYTRDVFTSRSDGLPIWCSECQNWKPERAHHSGEIQRCVRKMDHYCPWAGGMIGETCKSSQAMSALATRVELLLSSSHDR